MWCDHCQADHTVVQSRWCRLLVRRLSTFRRHWDSEGDPRIRSRAVLAGFFCYASVRLAGVLDRPADILAAAGRLEVYELRWLRGAVLDCRFNVDDYGLREDMAEWEWIVGPRWHRGRCPANCSLGIVRAAYLELILRREPVILDMVRPGSC